MLRQPAVAGQFYPGNSEQLRRELAQCIPMKSDRHKAFGIISPHAGYVYSGAIAGQVYAAIDLPDTVLILGPNHRGVGAAVALYPEGEWLTPLGIVPVNPRLNFLLEQHVPFVTPDYLAHQNEHSLEVQVPFLQYLRPDVSISAICLGHRYFDAVIRIGEGIAEAIKAFGSNVLIVASSDMTHYESAGAAQQKDALALERVMAFDPQGLLKVCRDQNISMCGALPSAVMLVAARALGATSAELVCYGTSGDVSGDNRQVVGYAAVAVW
jgi:AmmeMemoRadiSam system protein B